MAEHSEIKHFGLSPLVCEGSLLATRPLRNTVESNTLASRHGSAEMPLGEAAKCPGRNQEGKVKSLARICQVPIALREAFQT